MSGRTMRRILSITGMHCASCAMAIDMDLEDIPGVQQARTSYARATTEVIFDPTRASLEAIVGVIREAGYTAHPDSSEGGR